MANAECGVQSEELKLRIPNSEFRTPNSELQRGFTLIEVIVVIVILSIVSAITIYFLVNSLEVYTMSVNHKTLLDEGKLALERMCRDIRDARSITTPASGGSGGTIRFTRNNATAQDVAGEDIRFQLSGTTLEKRKSSPNVTVALASNVSAFTVNREITNDEITIILTLYMNIGGTVKTVILRTKVYPKNLSESTTYKNFGIQDSSGSFTSWQEVLSP